MLTLPVIEAATVVVGTGSCALALRLAYLFWRQGKPLGGPLGWMMFGETVVVALTVVFSLATLLGYRWSDHPYNMAAMRLSMFAASSLTSLHLHWSVRRLWREIA